MHARDLIKIILTVDDDDYARRRHLDGRAYGCHDVRDKLAGLLASPIAMEPEVVIVATDLAQHDDETRLGPASSHLIEQFVQCIINT